MKDTYFLNRETLPKMPLPHDSVISGITAEDSFMTLTLETNTESKDDPVQYYKPGAKGLIIRYHITDRDSLAVYKEKRLPRYLSRLFPPRLIRLDRRRLEKSMKENHRLAYLYHYVGDSSVIIKLFSYAETAEILLEADADYAEYEWIF